jgi:hypothetical protein
VSPQPPIITEPRPLARHPQRPWRASERPRQRAGAAHARTFAAPVVRELPPRRELRVATW